MELTYVNNKFTQFRDAVKGAPSTCVHCGRTPPPNTEIKKVICVLDNRIVSMFLLRRVSQPAIALGCEDTIRFSNTIRTFLISVLQQMISVKCTTAMHSDWIKCPFNHSWILLTICPNWEPIGFADVNGKRPVLPICFEMSGLLWSQ